MFPSNVPDDWHLYYTNCSTCGKLYHQSENYCSCYDKEDDSVDEESDVDPEIQQKIQTDFINFIELLVSNGL